MVQRGKSFSEWTWLEWLVKVRIIVITCVLAIELAITNLTVTNVNRTLFVAVIVLWYSISLLHMLLLAVWRDWKIQAKIQILADMMFTTAVVYVTGGIDTSFNFIYPLIIIVASVLLSQWWAYLTAALSFILLGSTLELVHFDFFHSYSMTRSDLRSLQAVIFINLFAFITVAYLAGKLSNRLRQVGQRVAVEERSAGKPAGAAREHRRLDFGRTDHHRSGRQDQAGQPLRPRSAGAAGVCSGRTLGAGFVF